MAVSLALRRFPDCSPLMYACPSSPVLLAVSHARRPTQHYAYSQERILAKVLFDASPAELAREVEHRCEDLGEPQAFRLVRDRRGGLLEQISVE